MAIELTLQDLNTRGGVLDKLLTSAFDAALVINSKGFIIFSTSGAFKLTMVSGSEMIGHHFSEFDTVSPFDSVLCSGIAEENIIAVIQGHKCLQSIYPVRNQGSIIGAIGIITYSNLNSLSKLILNVDNIKMPACFELQDLAARIERNYTFTDYIGENKYIVDMIYELKMASATSYPILITGETGTGKEILASAIHSSSSGSQFRPYVKINCAAIPGDLLESELFGYSKGAFTGAQGEKKGKFEVASGGTILLDEIGDMDLRLQSKLLRVLEEREFEKIGGVRPIPLKARILASTNKNLKQLCNEGRFRKDLYYRLNTIEVNIPPLRDRLDDIPLLVSYFLEQTRVQFSICNQVMEFFQKYEWPGNVRELRNTINRLSISCVNRQVGVRDLDKIFGKDNLADILEFQNQIERNEDDFEKGLIIKTLQEYNNNISKASIKLGITRATLYRRMQKYNITVNSSVLIS